MEGQEIEPLATEDETVVIINAAINSIANQDAEELAEWLQYIPLDGLDRDDTDYLLDLFLSQTAQYQYVPALEIIFATWEKVYPLEERGKISFSTLLFTINIIEISTLAYTVDNIEDITFFNTIEELIPSAPIYQVGMVCQKVFDTFYTWREFTETDYTMFKALQTEAYSQQNTDVYNFLTEKLRKIAPYAPIPSWVKDFRHNPEGIPITEDTNIETLPTDAEMDIDIKLPDLALPSNKELATILLEGLSANVGIDVAQEAQEILTHRLAMANIIEKMELISPYRKMTISKELENDLWLYRLYGPANTQFYPSSEESSVGGARMFSSVLFDNDADSGITEDWFLGFCLQCDLRIRRRWHAVRRPVGGGGWLGCYCSWKCARESILEPDAFDEAVQPDILTPALIDSVEAQIYKFGIQDRRDDGKDILDLEDVPPPLIPGTNPMLYSSSAGLLGGGTIRDLYELQRVPTIPELLTGEDAAEFVRQGPENVITDTETSSTIELAGMEDQDMTIHPSALEK